MTRINLNRPLTPETNAKILTYLESRPLREVYGLFQTIIRELEEPANMDVPQPAQEPPEA